MVLTPRFHPLIDTVVVRRRGQLWSKSEHRRVVSAELVEMTRVGLKCENQAAKQNEEGGELLGGSTQ